MATNNDLLESIQNNTAQLTALMVERLTMLEKLVLSEREERRRQGETVKKLKNKVQDLELRPRK